MLSPGENCRVVMGAYANHPELGPICMKMPALKNSTPNRYTQYDSALSRGNATSRAPICSGMM